MAKIRHIAIRTDKTEEMATFFQDVFGLQLVQRLDLLEWPLRGVALDIQVAERTEQRRHASLVVAEGLANQRCTR